MPGLQGTERAGGVGGAEQAMHSVAEQGGIYK